MSRVEPPSGFVAPALAGETVVAVAVSGGGDSTALLLALRDAFAGAAPRLLALTVDHGLRPDSADEARAVAALCAELGIEHRTLEWTGPKPVAGLSEAARLARYRLLAQAARDAGARIVLTGHTADDQAETVAMRGARGDGPGLAGIAPATLYDGAVWFARPLIGCRRDGLRRWLIARGASWIDDPSNADPARERARVRARLTQGGVTERLIGDADAAGAKRRALMRAVGATIDVFATQPVPGLVRLDPALFGETGTAAVTLRLVAAAVGGVARPANVERAGALALRIAAGERFRATLSRCVIDASPKGVFLHREWRGGGPEAVDCVDGAVFDERWRVAEWQSGLHIEPAGDRAPKEAGRLADSAARAEPVVAGGTARLVRVVSPFALFLPDFDLPAANALARLLRADEFPASPWPGHNGAIGS